MSMEPRSNLPIYSKSEEAGFCWVTPTIEVCMLALLEEIWEGKDAKRQSIGNHGLADFF